MGTVKRMASDNDSNKKVFSFQESTCKRYFSVSYSLIVLDMALPYDLYVNSSSLDAKEKFVKLVKKGDVLNSEDLARFESKYRQLYVAETQRDAFFSSLSAWLSKKGRNIQTQVSVLKESAIMHLENIFDKENLTSDSLLKGVHGCRDAVCALIELIKDYELDNLKNMIGGLSLYDFYTFGHSVNVSMYSIILFKAICPEATRNELLTVGMGGLFHDIGKLKLPLDILNNVGKLTPEQYEQVKLHPKYGFDLFHKLALKPEAGADPSLISRVIMEHHENFDGSGYPNKVACDEIHVISRICAIADFFDAVTTKRSYQDPLTTAQALTLMTKYSGTKLDPIAFKIFMQLAEKFAFSDPGVDISPEFDPCQMNSLENGGFISSDGERSKLWSEQYGRILVLSQDVDEYKNWARTPSVKFWNKKNKMKLKKTA